MSQTGVYAKDRGVFMTGKFYEREHHGRKIEEHDFSIPVSAGKGIAALQTGRQGGGSCLDGFGGRPF